MSGNIPCFQSPWTNTLPESTRLVHKYILLSFVADKVKSCSLVCTDTPVSVNSSTRRQQVLCCRTQNKVSQNQVQVLRYANASHIKVSAHIHIHHILSLHTTHTYLRLLFHDYREAFNTTAPSKLIVKALTFRFLAVHIGTNNTGVPQGCVLSPPFYSFIQTLLCGHAHLCHLHRLSGPSHISQDLTRTHQTHITTETATQRLFFPHRLRRHGLQDPLLRVS